MALKHISRMLMEEEDMDGGRFSCHEDHPALRHAQQSLAQIISSDNATTTNTGIRNAAAMEAAGAQHRVRISSLDLLNMAFLRGREEASKLLPRDDRLVISPEPHHMEITGRASKLMAMAAPADDEMVDRMTASDCELPKEEMEHLRAAMADEAAARDAWRRRRKTKQQQQQVDMRTLLVRCAQVVDDDRRGA